MRSADAHALSQIRAGPITGRRKNGFVRHETRVARNSIVENANRARSTSDHRMWIFAYGSLIFRPSFEYLERRRAFLPDYVRRFWQGSPDHRGIPEAPGRVATLVPAAQDKKEWCGSCVYRLDPQHSENILAELDIREQAGFRDALRKLAVHDPHVEEIARHLDG